MNVDQILQDNDGRSPYSAWQAVLFALKQAGVEPVAPTSEESAYGMETPLPFKLTVYGKEEELTIDGGHAFHHPNTGAIVVYNRTRDRVHRKLYQRW
jgi:hypothetical protein